MGDIADMMLDGQMCQWCGVIIDDDKGYPVVCRGCQKEHNVNELGEAVALINGEDDFLFIKVRGHTGANDE